MCLGKPSAPSVQETPPPPPAPIETVRKLETGRVKKADKSRKGREDLRINRTAKAATGLNSSGSGVNISGS